MSTATKTKTTKTPPDDFAGILRSALKASDQTLYRVSMETSIGQDVLSRFVREERGLSLETAGRLAEGLMTPEGEVRLPFSREGIRQAVLNAERFAGRNVRRALEAKEVSREGILRCSWAD